MKKQAFASGTSGSKVAVSQSKMMIAVAEHRHRKSTKSCIMLVTNRKLIIREIAEDFNNAYRSVQDILIYVFPLCISRVGAKEPSFTQKRGFMSTICKLMAFTIENKKTTSFSVKKEGNVDDFHELQRCSASGIFVRTEGILTTDLPI